MFFSYALFMALTLILFEIVKQLHDLVHNQLFGCFPRFRCLISKNGFAMMGNCKGKEKWWKFPYSRWVAVLEKAAVSWAGGVWCGERLWRSCKWNIVSKNSWRNLECEYVSKNTEIWVRLKQGVFEGPFPKALSSTGEIRSLAWCVSL